MKACPLLSNPQVAEQWEELVENLDGNVKAAYQVWSLNRGNSIDKAPNGEPSILFQSLLNHFHGDKKKATKAKSYLYTKDFFSWFGDWTGEYETDDGQHPYEEHSVVVDANGEPLIVYHGGAHKAQLYPVYLNIRKPLVYDYEGTRQGTGFKGSKKYPFGYVAARQVDKAVSNGNDGVVYQNLFDPYLADNYGVFDNSQIKHILNNGKFASKDDIYTYVALKKGKTLTQSDADITKQIVDYISKSLGVPVHNRAEMAEYLKAHKSDIRAFIGKKARAQFKARLMKMRPDLSEKTIDKSLDKLHQLAESKENTAFIKAIIHWMSAGSIVDLDRDYQVAEKIYKYVKDKHVDVFKYRTLSELLKSPEMQPKKRDTHFDPNTEPTFKHERTETVDGRTFEIYDVEDSKDGMAAVCRALYANYAGSPWCLSTFTNTGKPTQSAWNYWQQYPNLKRKIAFENGKPVAFSSASESTQIIDPQYSDIQANIDSELPFFYLDHQDVLQRARNYYTHELDYQQMTDKQVDEFLHTSRVNRHSLEKKIPGVIQYLHDRNSFVEKIKAEHTTNVKVTPGEAWWDLDDSQAVSALGSHINNKPDSLLQNKAENAELDWASNNEVTSGMNVSSALEAKDVLKRLKERLGNNIDIRTFLSEVQHITPIGYQDDDDLVDYIRGKYEAEEWAFEDPEFGFFVSYSDLLKLADVARDNGIDAAKQTLQDRINGTTDDSIDFFKTSSGEVYGFVTPDGHMYLDETIISPEHPLHEYTHLWDKAVRHQNNKLWKQGVSLMKKIDLWNEIANSDVYGKAWKKQGIKGSELDDRIASEVHARLVGPQGEQILNDIAQKEGKRNIIAKLKDWLLKFWQNLKQTFGVWSDSDLNDLTLEDFNRMTIRDFAMGVDIRKYLSDNQDNFGIQTFTSPSINNEAFGKQVYDIRSDVHNKEQQFIQNVTSQYKANTGKEMPPSQINKALTTFQEEQLQSIIDQHQQIIANNYKLTLVDGVYTSTRPGKQADYIEYIVNALNPQTFENYKKRRTAKWQVVAPVQSNDSVVNVIRQALFDGNVSTLDKEMVRDYLRIFWDSDLVQTGLDVVSSGKSLSSAEAEQQLVDAITAENYDSRVHNKTIMEYAKDFWQKLNALVKKIFGAKNYSAEQKNQIIQGLQVAQMWNEDLQTSKDLQHVADRADKSYEDSIPQSDGDVGIVGTIQAGTKTRLKAARAKRNRDEELINNIRTQIEKQEHYNPENVRDEYDACMNFVEQARKELSSTYVYMQQLYKKPIEEWDAEEINAIQRDTLGYYRGLINEIVKLFPETGDTALALYNKMLVEDQVKKGSNNIYNLRAALRNAENDISLIDKEYQDRILIPYATHWIDEYIDQEPQLKDKQKFKDRAHDFLYQQANYAHLDAGEVMIGFASRSRSNLVRIIQKITQDSDQDRAVVVLKKGQQLVRKYNKIRPIGSQMSPVNYQKRFLAMDEHGVPTGYLIDKLNRGLFYIQREAYIETLNNEYSKEKYGKGALKKDADGNVLIDDYGNPVFSEDEDETADNSVYNQYMDHLDRWLCDHCERRYKYEYYKQRRRYLSRNTIEAMRQIDRDLALLKRQATVDDDKYIGHSYYDSRKLTQAQRDKLEILRKRRRDLSSHYIITKDTNGLIHVEEKQGEALKIADQITRWNQFLSQHRKYNPDWSTLYKLADKISKDENNPERIQFIKDNTTHQITDEFWRRLDEAVGHYEDPQLKMLQKRHRELINAMKDVEGLASPNLTHAGTGLGQDRSMWKAIKKVEQQIADRKKELEAQGVGKVGAVANGIKFGTIAHMADTTFIGDDGNTRTFRTWLYEQWRNPIASNTDLGKTWNDLFTFIGEDKYGRPERKLLSVFKYLSPNGFNCEYTDDEGNIQSFRAIETVPISQYSELDETSGYVNPDYDKTDFHSMQPKMSLYADERYKNLTKDELEFLDMLKDTLMEANSEIPQRALSRDYLMPQITGRNMSVLGSTINTTGKVMQSVGYCVQNAFGKEFMETEADASTNMNLPVRPDGSVVNNIPIRYTKRLKNRALLTTDVVGAIITYYDMAMNFKYKSKNIDAVEIIDRIVGNIGQNSKDKSSGKFGRQAEKIDDILQQYYYGKTTRLGDYNEPVSDSKARVINTAKTFRKLTTAALLASNFTTIQVGLLDAMTSSWADAIGGKYMTKSDLVWGITQSWKHFANILIRGEIGDPDVDDKLSAAMQYNQLSKSNSEIFGRTDQSKWSRLMHQYFTMGGYSLSDYIINAGILMTFYHACRLIENPSTGEKKFLNRSEAINFLQKYGYSKKDAAKTWKKSKVTLWDAYYVKDGFFTVKDEYKNIVDRRTERLMTSKLKDRTAMYNGVIPATERAKLQSHALLSYFLLMRGFLANTYFERFQNGIDYADLGEYNSDEKKRTDKDISWSSEFGSVRKGDFSLADQMGYEDLATGEYQGAVFKDSVAAIGKVTRRCLEGARLAERKMGKVQLTENQRYAVRKSAFEIGCIVFMLAALCLFLIPWVYGNDGDDDKDASWTINLIPGQEPLGININTNNADRSFKNWMRWKLLNLATKYTNERLTPWSMATVMDLIKSPTVATSYYDNLTKMVDLSQDILTGSDLNEKVQSGGYKHMNKGTRDILQLFSAVPINNLVKDLHTSGQKATYNYYRNQAILNFFLPSMKEWKDDNGISSSSSSSSSGLGQGLSSEGLGEGLGSSGL